MRQAADLERTAVLLMGYGSPAGPQEIPEYLTDVLGGHAPSPATVQEYQRRYALIGGSPQLRILQSLRAKLERRVASEGWHPTVYFGVKHLRPSIADSIVQARQAGVGRLVAIPLSPYASPWILRPYQAEIARGCKLVEGSVEVELRAGWHRQRHLIEYWARSIGAARPMGTDRLMLSAHSLPERHHRAGDPYSTLLAETAALIEGAIAPLQGWFTYQSAGNTTEPWLGPDITERIVEWKECGGRSVTVAPFGFLFDHLEVLYDLDVVVRRFAESQGIGYRRVPSPNDAAEIVEALREVALAPSAEGPSPESRGNDRPQP